MITRKVVTTRPDAEAEYVDFDVRTEVPGRQRYCYCEGVWVPVRVVSGVAVCYCPARGFVCVF